MGIDGHSIPRRFRIVSGEFVGRWVGKKIRGPFNPEASVAIGLQCGDDLRAGVIYENWNHRSITCHIAIEGRITSAYVAAIFDYPFNVAQVEKIICPVASCNEESIRLVENMGFREEARIQDAHPEGDLILFTLTRQDCRFLGERYGKRLKPAARS